MVENRPQSATDSGVLEQTAAKMALKRPRKGQKSDFLLFSQVILYLGQLLACGARSSERPPLWFCLYKFLVFLIEMMFSLRIKIENRDDFFSPEISLKRATRSPGEPRSSTTSLLPFECSLLGSCFGSNPVHSDSICRTD